MYHLLLEGCAKLNETKLMLAACFVLFLYVKLARRTFCHTEIEVNRREILIVHSHIMNNNMHSIFG